MTLTQAAFWTKRLSILGGAVLLIFITVAFIVLNFPTNTTPPEYLKPNFACTETKEEFTQNKLSIQTLSLGPGSELVYEVETETGQVDKLQNVINVYKYNNPGQSLNAQEDAKIVARKLGFDPEAIQRQGSAEYVWKNAKTSQILTVQARNLNFVLATDFTHAGTVPHNSAETPLPSNDEAISMATNILKGNGWMLDDYSKTTPLATLINVQPDGTFSQANSREEAELIRVDFYRDKSLVTIRSDISNAKEIKTALEKKFQASQTDIINVNGKRLEIYTFNTEVTNLDTQKSNISVYIGPKNTAVKDTDLKNLYGIDFTNWVIDTLPCGTYPLISPYTALDIVQKGQGSLVYLNVKDGDDVIPYQPLTVKKFRLLNIKIVYYDPPQEQSFLQPVYLISGEATFDNGRDGKFYYFVPAINYDLVQNKIVDTMTEQQGGVGAQ